MPLTKDFLKKYKKPEYFFNRELSWLEFNRRVLDEAFNPELPLLDRVKFISIFFSNLDEFYMIRVSGLKEQTRARVFEPTIDGMTPQEQLKRIALEVEPMLSKIFDYWNNTILKEFRDNNISLCGLGELSRNETRKLNDYFKKEIYPVLTPLAFDPGRPFPYLSNLSLSYAVVIEKKNKEKHFARVKIPAILPRLIRIDELLQTSRSRKNGRIRLIWIDDIIKENLKILFPGVKILAAFRFRITRNTDLEIQEDEADDLLETVEENIKQRKFGSCVRLEVEKDMPEFMVATLTENLEISKSELQIINGPLGMSDVMQLYGLPKPNLKEKKFLPRAPKLFDDDESIFSTIRKKDILLHHPYDSFAPVIDLIKKASQDPHVLAIKQTLYRVGSDSPIVKYLIEAAERKKQVAVLVELKARFDEENNIFWARELEKAGVHVVYGLVGLKTHSKMTLIVRKESQGVKRYVHLGTGNYNQSTAKLYTDHGLLTDDEDLCADVSEIFNFLTGYSEQMNYRKLLVAPLNIRSKMIELIQREIRLAKKGVPGHLIFKTNSLVDPTLITALYEASRHNVKIDLIVRGICCLIPGLKGISENIQVISIVGRFLEHSRIYYFRNGGKEEIYMGSADLMPRNLDRRVETIFPIEDKDLLKEVKETVLDISLKDNTKSRVLLPSGSYKPVNTRKTEESINLQEWLMHYSTVVKKDDEGVSVSNKNP